MFLNEDFGEEKLGKGIYEDSPTENYKEEYIELPKGCEDIEDFFRYCEKNSIFLEEKHISVLERLIGKGTYNFSEYKVRFGDYYHIPKSNIRSILKEARR